MMQLRTAVVAVAAVVAVLAVVATARPQDGGDGGEVDIMSEVLGRSAGIAAAFASGAMSTFQAIADQLRLMAASAWTSSAQVAMQANAAFRDTTVEALRGVQSASDTAGKYAAEGVRAAGRMAADVTKAGWRTTQDVVNRTSVFVADVGGNLVQSAASTGEGAMGVAQALVASAGGFAQTANQAVGEVVVTGIENFSNNNELELV